LEQRCHLRPSKLRGNKCRGCPGRGRVVNFASVARGLELSPWRGRGVVRRASALGSRELKSIDQSRSSRGYVDQGEASPRDGKSGGLPFQGIPRWGGKWNVKRAETGDDQRLGRILRLFHFEEQAPVRSRGNGRPQSGGRGAGAEGGGKQRSVVAAAKCESVSRVTARVLRAGAAAPAPVYSATGPITSHAIHPPTPPPSVPIVEYVYRQYVNT
jgi:hypothetical protein